MTDIETIIERDLDRAASIKGRENRHRWLLALIASRTIGRRIPGLTVEFARRCGLAAPDAVEHWAKAWRLYEAIRLMSVSTARHFRKELTVSHFYAMYDLINQYNLELGHAFGYFRVLLTHKENGDAWSVAVLRAEVDADYPNGNAVDYRWHISRIQKNIDALLTFGELPIPWRAWARMYKGLKGKVK